MAALDTNVLVPWLTNDRVEPCTAMEKLLLTLDERASRLEGALLLTVG